MSDRLLVSDEELAEVAIEFVKLNLQRKAERQKYRVFQEANPCLAATDQVMKNCVVGLKLGRLFRVEDFCINCQLVRNEYVLLRRLSAQRNGKLRRLQTMVRKRLEG